MVGLMDELSGDSVTLAPRLLGSWLIREHNGQRLVGRIVETEAYHQQDAASHSYRGETPRNSVMFGPAGTAYVYFTYGMHYCFNVVTGPAGYGSAVLIRALEPVSGIAAMRRNRQAADLVMLTNGPAKLCQALLIDKRLNGHDLSLPPLQLRLKAPLPPREIVRAPRVGISQAKEHLWRFYLASSPFVSKPH